MVAELVCFINQNQVIIFGIPVIEVLLVKHFVQTPVRYKFCVLVNAEVSKGRFPVLFYGRWIDNKNCGVIPSVLNQELSRNHRGDNGLSQTDHISKEETVIAKEFLVSFIDGIYLIFVTGVTSRNPHWVLDIGRS